MTAQKGLLAQSRLRQIVRNIRRLYPKAHALPDEVRKALAYLVRNRARMRYKQFREAGYPDLQRHCRVYMQSRRSGTNETGRHALESTRPAICTGLALLSALRPLAARYRSTRSYLNSQKSGTHPDWFVEE